MTTIENKEKTQKKEHIGPFSERADCFANKEKSCDCLTDNDFGDRACPFFKKRENVSRIQGKW